MAPDDAAGMDALGLADGPPYLRWLGGRRAGHDDGRKIQSGRRGGQEVPAVHVSGIWQTVWLETVPTVHITSAQITPAVSGKVAIRLGTSAKPTPQATVSASLDGTQVATTTGPSDTLTLTIPGDAAMRSDIEFLKAAGFNTIRKHIKVEPRRYYTHCDRLGMLVWQDQVSSGTGKKRGEQGSSSPWTRLQPDPVDADWPDRAHQQYLEELRIMIHTLGNHPSIVQWVTFNEAWGQHRSLQVGKWTVAADPTRQINIASGGNFYPVGHIVDHHQYPHPDFPFDLGQGGRFDGFVKVVGEFGGHGFPVPGHLWNPNARNWGYGGLPKDKDEWLERYKTSIARLAELKKRDIAAGIYTQTTDVEGEVNGLISYDRKVRKLAPQVLAEIHHQAGLVP